MVAQHITCPITMMLSQGLHMLASSKSPHSVLTIFAVPEASLFPHPIQSNTVLDRQRLCSSSLSDFTANQQARTHFILEIHFRASCSLRDN